MYDYQCCGYLSSIDRVVVIDYRTNTLVPVTRRYIGSGNEQEVTAVLDGRRVCAICKGLYPCLYEIFAGRSNVTNHGLEACNPCDCRGWNGDVIQMRVLRPGFLLLENRSLNRANRFVGIEVVASMLGDFWYCYFNDGGGVWRFYLFNQFGRFLDVNMGLGYVRTNRLEVFQYRTLNKFIF